MTNPDFQVRQALLEDIAALAEYRLQMLINMGRGTPEEIEVLRQPTEAYLAETMPTGEFLGWLAEADGQVIGIAGVIVRRKPPALKNPKGLEGYILSVFTHPDWRRRGVATALMQAILDYLRAKGIRRACLHASDAGRPVYEKLGFEAVTREMRLDL
ncbi:MAG TPA: GNAT family N-acetyltransferase [Anaerolineaceae bacterium]|jgi:GNAT superfamily N-acetyltransferase|nr:GNAT family N-acetyltransferase [Anaerolineaceae bacterium]HOG79103.1 GNAT family N-acetyltransferase [Anaerolineaceae bacterium]HQN43388.1 GNAT family N-acetyltransferase [Anaerolineaceae bacterium]